MSTTAMAFPRELLTPPCRHERVEFPARPLPDAWYVCPDCGERVGLRGGRVLTMRESNAIAEPITTELKPGRSYVVRLTEHVSPEALEVLVERLKQTAPQSGFVVVDASVISVEEDDGLEGRVRALEDWTEGFCRDPNRGTVVPAFDRDD